MAPKFAQVNDDVLFGEIWASHTAVEVPGEDVSNEWLEPVDDKYYNDL